MSFKHLLIFTIFSVLALAKGPHPEAKLPFADYCNYYNYPVESHDIITEDGYILQYFRIQAKNSTIKSGLPVVFLQHGLLDASDDWILNDESITPGFVLANRGYDVWLGNSRGNKHSRRHQTLNPDKDKDFWAFSWQEMAQYDLPAAFTYITNYTQQEKIDYIGHSQGTIQMFAALSDENQVILSKLNKFIALGPVTHVYHHYSNVFKIAEDLRVQTLYKIMGWNEFMGDTFLINKYGTLFCQWFDKFCDDLIGWIADADPSVDDYERYDVLAGHLPAGTSLQNMNHWIQLTKADVFRKFDYGSVTENVKRYGQPTPPDYNLGNIRINVTLYSGNTDRLADPTDVAHLITDLVNVPKLRTRQLQCGHLSFIWGNKDVMTYFNEVLDILASEY